MAFLLIAELPNDRATTLTQSIVTPRQADARRARKIPSRKRVVNRRIVATKEPLHRAATGSVSVPKNEPVVSRPLPKNEEGFPLLTRTVMPVSKTPNWGKMTNASQWNRSFREMQEQDFIALPAYDLKVLTTPMQDLIKPRKSDMITAKLFYSTRYFGTYDLDSGEYTGSHPGIDLKLPIGTPITSIGAGIVRTVETSDTLGLHVIIEHRLASGETYYSIYGHLGQTSVTENQTVRAGTTLGTIGMTGNTSGGHLHLQIDLGKPNEQHVPYEADGVVTREEARRSTVHPIAFIEQFARGED